MEGDAAQNLTGRRPPGQSARSVTEEVKENRQETRPVDRLKSVRLKLPPQDGGDRPDLTAVWTDTGTAWYREIPMPPLVVVCAANL
jgi:hypothetical protein